MTVPNTSQRMPMPTNRLRKPMEKSPSWTVDLPQPFLTMKPQRWLKRTLRVKMSQEGLKKSKKTISAGAYGILSLYQNLSQYLNLYLKLN